MRTFLSILAVCFCCVAAQAQPYKFSHYLEEEHTIHPPQMAGTQNAAWLYIEAWDSFTSQEDRIAFAEATGGRPERGTKLTKAQREQLEKHRSYIEKVMAAAGTEECDWGARLEDGIMCLLPHLGQMRSSCRALGVDAVRCAEDGNSAGAAERIVAILRLSTHVATDKVLISTLVGTAIGAYAMNATEDMLADKQLTPAAARMILNGIKATITKDLYNTFASIDVERKLTIDYARRKCTGDTAGMQFMKLMGDMGQGGLYDPADPSYAMIFADEAQLGRELDRAEHYYDAVKAGWYKELGWVRLDELELEAREGQWGLATQMMGAPYSKVRRSSNQILRQFKRVTQSLTKIVEQNDAGAAEAHP